MGSFRCVRTTEVFQFVSTVMPLLIHITSTASFSDSVSLVTQVRDHAADTETVRRTAAIFLFLSVIAGLEGNKIAVRQIFELRQGLLPCRIFLRSHTDVILSVERDVVAPLWKMASQTLMSLSKLLLRIVVRPVGAIRLEELKIYARWTATGISLQINPGNAESPDTRIRRGQDCNSEQRS